MNGIWPALASQSHNKKSQLLDVVPSQKKSRQIKVTYTNMIQPLV